MTTNSLGGNPTSGLRDAKGRPYIPAVSPRLKVLLALIFLSVAVLGASGAYLTSIRLLDSFSGQTYTKAFKYWMLLAHVGVGLVMLIPFLAFGILHWRSAFSRPNRYAVKLGILLFSVGVLVCASGLALIRLDGMPQLRTDSSSHSFVLWLHVLLPLLAVVLYILHRKAGPDIKWSWGAGWGVVVGLFCVAMLYLHSQDPRQWNVRGPEKGLQYFHPAASRTATGNFIPAETLMMDEYCKKCHADIYNDHLHSAHRFSSFNNPAYLFAVRETREVSLKRDANVQASRWCAGCHDQVPFFSGAFDNPKFDDVKDPTAHAGITCTVCHAITNIDSVVGNGAYTIEEPEHYPLAFSKNRFLQYINNQLVKAEPSFHKKTFLKPFHKTAEFCSTCHKVSLPVELNYYKEFLRGQNHYDTYLLSGVSGHGVRSFYYPPQAKSNCAACHMPPKPSADFGAKDFDGDGGRKVHNHRFPAANTGLFELLKKEDRYKEFTPGYDESIRLHTEFLQGKDPSGKKIRVDLFGIKDGGSIDGNLTVLRPELPKLQPGSSYLVEVVVRTVLIGHPLSQGTVDSNEIWVDFEAAADGKLIARNGALANADEVGEVDRWAHYINVLMLDRDGHRINRRNPQDIFTPLYDHQIPPGAAATVHYRLDIPAGIKGPVDLRVRVRYRKFDQEYMQLVYKNQPVPKLPIVDICEDRVKLPVMGGAEHVETQTSPIQPAWQRWNDYGIGCFLEGGGAPTGLSNKRGEMKQARAAFQHLIDSGEKEAVAHGWLNLARVLIDDVDLAAATNALNKASEAGAYWWTVTWFKGMVAAENATRREDFDIAVKLFESILEEKNQPVDRGFDFRQDYVLLDMLGKTLFKRSQLERDDPQVEEQTLLQAIDVLERVLRIDPEDVDAHQWLKQCYYNLGRDAPVASESEDAKSIGVVSLQALANTITDQHRSRNERMQAALNLKRNLEIFSQRPLLSQEQPPVLAPKLPLIRNLQIQLRPVFHKETDAEVRVALAALLSEVHGELHAIYKPDDIARARTTTLYRQANPAANHAAEAIVIYPTTGAQREALRKRAGIGGE